MYLNSTEIIATTISSTSAVKGKSSNPNATLAYIITPILLLFIFVTIIGNGLVCLAFRRQPQLRRVSYYPILSLAVADLLCGALAMPAYIAKKYVIGGWQERVTCDIFRFAYFFAAYASVLNLTLISIERFVAVKLPVKRKLWLTKRKMSTALILSWLDAALVSGLPFFWRSDEKELCSYNPTKSWSIMVILLNVAIPFLIMFVCHLYTVSFAISYSRRRRKRTAEAKGLRKQSPENETSQSIKEIALSRKERDITCTMAIVVGAFAVCWAPSSLYYFIRMVCPQCYRPSFKQTQPVFNAVVKLMTFIYCCINPLICCWLNGSFKKAFEQSFLRRSEVRRRRFRDFSAITKQPTDI